MDTRKMPKKKEVNAYWQRGKNDRTCMACERTAPLLHRAHVLPRHRGGVDEPENIHLLCPGCHSESELLSGDAYNIWFDAIKDGDYFWAKLSLASWAAKEARGMGLDHLEAYSHDSSEVKDFIDQLIFPQQFDI